MNSVNSSDDEDMSPVGRSQVRGQKMRTVFLAVAMSVYIAKVVPLLITLYAYAVTPPGTSAQPTWFFRWFQQSFSGIVQITHFPEILIFNLSRGFLFPSLFGALLVPLVVTAIEFWIVWQIGVVFSKLRKPPVNELPRS